MSDFNTDLAAVLAGSTTPQEDDTAALLKIREAVALGNLSQILAEPRLINGGDPIIAKAGVGSSAAALEYQEFTCWDLGTRPPAAISLMCRHHSVEGLDPSTGNVDIYYAFFPVEPTAVGQITGIVTGLSCGLVGGTSAADSTKFKGTGRVAVTGRYLGVFYALPQTTDDASITFDVWASICE